MNVATARVTEVTALQERLFVLWFDCPEVTRLAHPGQFLMVHCGEGEDPFLARPFHYSRSRRIASRSVEYALLIEVAGRGSNWLVRRRPGDTLTVFGPLGAGLTLQRDTRNLLIVAHGVRLAALLLLAEQAIARDVSVTLVQGVAPDCAPYPAALLPPELELDVVPAGQDGRAIAAMLPEYLRWADQIVVAADEPLLRQLAADLRMLMLKRPTQAVVWTPLACGTGACAGCPIETRRRGSRLVCQDGPRIELRELY